MMMGCASELKRQCEKTDWFQYGQDSALAGRRLTGDPLILACNKEDVFADQALDQGFKVGREKYCTPDVAFQIGHRGENYNDSFCGESELGSLRKKHYSGTRAYCAVDNSFTVGSKGTPYTKVCTKDEEKIFFPGYYAGRRTFLNTQIEKNTSRIQYICDTLATLEWSRSASQQHLEALPSPHYEKRSTCETTDKGQKCTDEYVEVDSYSSARWDVHQHLSQIEITSLKLTREKTDLVAANLTLNSEIKELPVYPTATKPESRRDPKVLSSSSADRAAGSL